MAVSSDARLLQANVARSLVWLGIAALALGAWLAVPRARVEKARAPLEIILVDVSKSAVGAGGSSWSAQARTALETLTTRAAPTGADVAVVAFGRDVRTVIPPIRARELLERIDGAGFDPWRDLLESDARDGARETRLAAALELAATLASDRARAHVAIVGDGTFTGRDAGPAADALAGRGIGVEIERTPANVWNLALGPLRVPRAIEEGAPLVVDVDVRVDGDGAEFIAGHVMFTRHDAAGTTTFGFELPGRQSVIDRAVSTQTVHADLGPAIPGPIEIEARGTTMQRDITRSTDAMPEDDVSTALVRCAGSLVVGVVDAERSGKPLYDLLNHATSGVDLVALAPGDLARHLSTLDAVVTVDAPLSKDEERLLASFVEHGGGWLDVPGWSWISARAAGSTLLASIAALTPAKAALAPRDVVFLIDASGSMSGAPFDEARAALVSLVDAALPDDDVSVRFFAVDVSPPIPFGTGVDRADRERRRALAERVRTEREPGGATRLWLALETLVRERESSNAAAPRRDTLVLLLSDGQDPDRTSIKERAQALRARFAAAHMRLFALSPTEGADLELLTSLAGSAVSMPGVGADGQPNWSSVFRRELARELVRQRSNQPVMAVLGAAVPGGAGLAAPIARACGSVPPIDVAVRTDVRADLHNGAEVIWSGEDTQPLGAIARTGTGVVATLAFAPNTHWAPGWTEARTLAPLVRALARGHADRRGGPDLRVEGAAFVLEGVEASFPAPARATVRDASGASFDLVFEAGGSGLDPLSTRRAFVPAGLASGAGTVLVRFESGGQPALELAAPVPRAPEFVFERKTFVPPAHVALDRAGPGGVPVPHPLAPWALLSGLLMLATAAFLGAFSRIRG